mgnify:CR=1 FL=1
MMFVLWLRRVAVYFLRIVLPTSLLSQLAGTVLFGRSWPGGMAESWIVCVCLLVAVAASALSTRNGQSWAHRLLKLRVCDQDSGMPISGWRMGARELAHLADSMSLLVGFLWPLWDGRGQTFADKIVKTIVIEIE